jgi:hypothetical protein
LLGLGLWATYVFTAAPGLAWYDAGELTAAAASLGISHPTGFPLWVLLAKAAALVPVGPIPLRITLLGAACLVGAALLAGWLAAQLPGRAGGGPWSAGLAFVVAALGLGLSAAAWRHATAAEVYGLHLLVLAALVAGLVRFQQRPSTRLLLLLALLAGLGLGNHGELRLLLLLLGPALVIVAWRRVPWRALPWAGGLLLAGLAVYLYLPLRGAAAPLWLWDTVDELDGLLRHVSGERIFLAFADRIGVISGPLGARHLDQLLGRLTVDLALLVLPAALGALLLIRAAFGHRLPAPTEAPTEAPAEPPTLPAPRPASRLLLVLLVGVTGLDLLYTLLVNPMGIPAAQVLLPTVFGVATLAGVGCGELLGAGRDPLLAGAGALVLGGGALATVGYGDLSDKVQPHLVAPERLVGEVLAVAGPHALVLTVSDSLTAGLAQARVVEGRRPDLRHAARQHIWNPAGRRQVADLIPPGHAPTVATLLATQLGRRPVRWEHGGGEEEQPWLDRLVPGLPTWRVAAEPVDPPLPPVDLETYLDRLEQWTEGIAIGAGGREAYMALLQTIAWHEGTAGRWPRAGQTLLAALRIVPDSPRLLFNLGAVYSHLDRLPEALQVTEEGVRRDPVDFQGQLNLGRYRLALRDPAGAEEAFRLAWALRPASVAALSGLGAAVASQRRYDEAASLLEEALRLDPDHAEARENLRQVNLRR